MSEQKEPYFAKKKPRVLCIGDAAYPLSTTGFAIVMGKVIDGFMQAGWDVVHFGRGMRERKEEEPLFRIYMPPAMDANGYHYVDQVVEWEQPDLIFINADPGSIGEWRRNVEVRRIKNLVYVPTEGSPLLAPWSDMLQEILWQDGRLTTYTNFSKDVIREGLKEEPKFEIEVLGHGIDHAPFRKYDAEARRELRKKLGWTDKFVVMNVARNAARKNFPKLFEAVKLARQKHDDIVLYAHTVAYENFFLGGHNLMELRRYLDLEGAVQFHAEMRDGTQGIAYSDSKDIGLIDLYNAADAFVSTSGAEGWNLPMCEAAQCGLPVITPMYSGSWEVARYWALGIPVYDYETHSTGLRMASLRAQEVADKIVCLRENPSLRSEFAGRGQKAAARMKWEPTVKRLVEIAKEML